MQGINICKRLAPGNYHFALASGKGNDRHGLIDFDIIYDVLPFEVMPAQDDGARASWAPNWGSIRFIQPSVDRNG